MLVAREKINNSIFAYMLDEGYSLKPNSKTPHALDSWMFSYINAGGNPDNIKIEINYTNRCHVLPLVSKSVTIDFIGNIQVRVLSPIELFASKINALINRSAARDIYDVYGMITEKLFENKPEKELLRKTLVFYIAVGSISKAEDVTLEFDVNQIEAFSFAQVRSQLLPVLRRSEKFDFQQGKEVVIDFLKDLLVFSEDEYNFIKCFNSRVYRPGLLFNEESIIKAVESHPMALWKCRPL